MAPPPLTRSAVGQAIEGCCASWNKKQQSWTLHRADEQDLLRHRRKGSVKIDAGLLWGIRTQNVRLQEPVLTAFYFAYSSWDGRVIYVDTWGVPAPVDGLRVSSESLHALMRCVLGQLAIRLHCKRLTWQHEASASLQRPGSLMPETMNGVLTLHWSDERMKGFLGCNRPAQRTASETVRDTIARCLAMSNPPEKFLLKLVSAADVDDLLRMVEGLAEYVNEPDAVHVSRETYLRDGFSDETPLFYSLLLEYSDSETKQPHICGMAFCYLGCSLRDGHFLYLEDLFLEEAYRGKGVGTYTLRTLAAIALSLGCSRLVWQALDWNKPALAFYDKIGADTQQGLLTSRFTGKQLSALSEARVPP